MSKMSKAIAVLGVVAGLGVAALPLSSYAADPTGASASKAAQVVVEVGGAISIEITNPGTVTQVSGVTVANDTLTLNQAKINGAISKGSLGVRVLTNAAEKYSLNMKAQGTTDMVGSGTAAGSSIKTTASLAQGTAGWAYSMDNGTTWKAIPDATGAGDEINPNGQTASVASQSKPFSEVTDVTFGVAADETTPEGTYTGNVTFTATVK